jgi:hypothetical protein
MKLALALFASVSQVLSQGIAATVWRKEDMNKRHLIVTCA